MRPRSIAAAVVASACALAVSSAAIAPAAAMAASTRPLAPVEETTGTGRLSGASDYSAARAAKAARRVVNLARKSRPVPRPPAPTVRYGPWRTALCSWYWQPQPLAGGGYLRPGMMIVAHKTLPFGQKVQFSYRGRSCIAVVKDRGPYVGGREFDLGPGTADALNFDGVDRVSYRLVY